MTFDLWRLAMILVFILVYFKLEFRWVITRDDSFSHSGAIREGLVRESLL